MSRLWIYPASGHEVGQEGHECAVPTGLGPPQGHPLHQGSRPKSSTTSQEHFGKGIGKYTSMHSMDQIISIIKEGSRGIKK